MEKDPIKYSTRHTEIHDPTIANMYFESAGVSMDASGCWEVVTGQRRLPDRMDLHGYSSSCRAWTVWPKQILQLPRLLKLWAWGVQTLFPRLWGAHKGWPFQPTGLPRPSLSLRCQNMTSGRTRSVREGGGGRIPTHFLHLEARIEAILLMTYCWVLLFALFCPSEKKLPYFSNCNCFSLLLIQLTTLQLAASWVDVSEWQQIVFI